MPTVTATAELPGVTPAQVWDAVESPTALSPTVLEVVPDNWGHVRWTVLLNGSRVEWVQRTARRDVERFAFEQVEGDFDRLTGEWSVLCGPGGVTVRLALDFHLGVDGLAPLLDPIWTQSLQAHADALVAGVGQQAAAPTTRPGGLR